MIFYTAGHAYGEDALPTVVRNAILDEGDSSVEPSQAEGGVYRANLNVSAGIRRQVDAFLVQTRVGLSLACRLQFAQGLG